MKNICFVTTGDIRSIATAKRALGLASPLVDLGWNVYILIEDTPENRHRAALECPSSVNVIFFEHCVSAWREVRLKCALLRNIKLDFIYICAFVFRNVVGKGIGAKILVEHSELQSSISGIKWWKLPYVILNEFASVLFSDGLLNASSYLQEIYRKRAALLFRKKLPMLYFPYAYHTVSEEEVQIKAEIPNLNDGNKVFLFIGSIVAGYGAYTMVEALRTVSKCHPEARLFLLGKGGDFEKVQEYVEKVKLQEFVYMPGYVSEEDIPGLFSRADYFLSPMNDTVQDWARCPSKLYMYLPYGKPIVTCKIGEPAIVLGDEGTYYQPSSASSLASAMCSLLDSGKTAIRVDASKHTWMFRAKEFDNWISNAFL